VIFMDAPGCYGRNGAEDCAADAALLAILIRKPVRVQWMRIDETVHSPKSPPQVIDLEAGTDANNDVVAWAAEFFIQQNSMVAFKPIEFPLLAGLEAGLKKPGNWVGFLWQNATVPYSFPNVLVNTHHVSDTVFRSSHLRSPGRIENNFANESLIDTGEIRVPRICVGHDCGQIISPDGVANQIEDGVIQTVAGCCSRRSGSTARR